MQDLGGLTAVRCDSGGFSWKLGTGARQGVIVNLQKAKAKNVRGYNCRTAPILAMPTVEPQRRAGRRRRNLPRGAGVGR